MGMENYSKHQQSIIKRYYNNQDDIALQRAQELVTELYLTEGKKWNPYIQGGLLGEARKGGADFLSGSLRLGASNKHRTIGCGAGIDVNLLKGGIHPGLGCWVDVAGMVRHKRTASRAAAIAADSAVRGRAARIAARALIAQNLLSRTSRKGESTDENNRETHVQNLLC